MIAFLLERLQLFMSNDGADFLMKAAIAWFVMLILYYVVTIITKRVYNKMQWDQLENNKYTERAANLMSQILFVFLMLCAFLISLEIVWLSTALILWGMTIAIWFAMETTMGNMIAGVMLLTNPNIKVGQSIKLLWSINQIAKVEEFHIRYTVLRTLYKQRVIVPNSLLLHTPIQTKKTEPLIRGEIRISVARNYDLSSIQWLIKDIINSNKYVSHTDQTAIHIEWFSAKWYDLVCYYFYSPIKTKKVDFVISSEIRHKISEVFATKQIKFSYPRQTVRVRPKD